MTNRLDTDYLNLVQDILDNGNIKKDRTGTGTKSVFKREIRHKMSDGFPLLTTKKMAFNAVKHELRWFLDGNTNIKWLLEKNCNIWNGDAYKNYVKDWENLPIKYLFNKAGKEPCEGDDFYRAFTMEEFIEKIKTDDEFAEKWGELGPIYGKQWRGWKTAATVDKSLEVEFIKEGVEIDQIQQLIDDLLNNPDSRRLMVNAWNVGEIKNMVLPPCHFGFQCYTRELSIEEREEWMAKKGYGYPHTPQREEQFEMYNVPTRALSLAWEQRSVDVALGLPFNIASYGLLLIMLADEVNMVPEELIGSLGDCHIYLNQIDGIKQQLGREPLELPTLFVRDGIYSSSDGGDIVLENYQSHGTIKMPLSN